MKSALQKAGQKADLIQHRRRVVLVELAARAYELERGRQPVKIEDLVPDYLSAVPLEAGGHERLNWSPARSP